MFGFGKSNGKKTKERESLPSNGTAPASELSLFSDGRDRYFGLENFGSTCYANSVIQALYFTESFRKALINAPYGPATGDSTGRLPGTDLASGTAQKSLDELISEPHAQCSFVNVNAPSQSVAKKKKGLTVWTSEEEEKEELRKRAFYPKGELPASHPMFPDPPANKNDASFRGQEMKPTDDTATDLFKKKLLEEHLVVSPSPRAGSDAVLFHALRDLYSGLIVQKQRTGIVSPRFFMDSLRSENEMFRQNIHHDAHEFLNYVLNSVHDGYAHLTKKDAIRDTTFVHSIFEGTLSGEVRCLTCENITSRDETFLDLSLDIEENTSVSACMRAFSKSEFLREKNKFYCEKCNGLQEAERRMKIRKLPQILALHLKRFKFEQEGQRHVKLQHVVRYETTLRVGNTTDDAADPDRLYELYAVVVHLGGASYHGHYIACIRTDHLGWLLYDDEHVERIPDSVVMRFIGGEDSGTACAYVLFYRTVDLEESLESKASLSLPPDSVHAVQMPPQISHPCEYFPSPASSQNFSTSAPSRSIGIAVPQTVKEHVPLEKAQSYVSQSSSISSPQAAYMKRAGLARASSHTSSATPAKPAARRILSSVFSSSAASSTVTSPVSEIPADRPSSASTLSPTSTPQSVAKSVPRSLTMSNMPIYPEEKLNHHGHYTNTVVTSTPLNEISEPDWSVSAPVPIATQVKPQRPSLGEKKTTGLSRFSSFRGKRGSFFGGKKDEPGTEPEINSPTTEKLKRRTSVFGMGGFK